jgi:predicted transporter
MIDLLLWTGGTLFTLGVFAAKAGIGWGLAPWRWRGGLAVALGYLLLFVLLAPILDRLNAPALLLLGHGPLLHSLLALFLFSWGLLILCVRPAPARPDRAALLLVIPCPVCLAAIAFSLIAARRATTLSAPLLGLLLGLVFITLAAGFAFTARRFAKANRDMPLRAILGLGMILIGVYFLAALVVPAKIRSAERIYATFAVEPGSTANLPFAPVFGLLLALALIGFLARRKEF